MVVTKHAHTYRIVVGIIGGYEFHAEWEYKQSCELTKATGLFVLLGYYTISMVIVYSFEIQCFLSVSMLLSFFEKYTFFIIVLYQCIKNYIVTWVYPKSILCHSFQLCQKSYILDMLGVLYPTMNVLNL